MNKARLALWLGIAAMAWLPPLCRAASDAAIACQRPANAPASYLPDAGVDSLALLGPPPAPDSPAQRADLQAVLAAQRHAHASHGIAPAVADVEISCARIATAAAEYHGQAGADTAIEFLNRAAWQAAALTGPPKRYWQRPRPYMMSRRVERLGDVAPDAALPENPSGSAAYREQRDHSGYPSGHATFGQTCAMLLARMVPERRREYFARGLSYGDSRVVIGAHYPSDVAAGRTLAAAAVALMFANPCFAEDFNSARGALRQSLGLALAPPGLSSARPRTPRLSLVRGPSPHAR